MSTKEFLKECKETRADFSVIAQKYTVSENLELRTEIDSLLIMYDQLCETVRRKEDHMDSIRRQCVPMIFKLEFPDKTEYAQARDLKHLEKEYSREYGDDWLDIKKVTIISKEVAKDIMLKSNEPGLISKFSLFDSVGGDYFEIVASTDWD